MSFQWDRDKAATNRRKHRVEFADAVGVFEDPRALTRDDPDFEEDRYVTVGMDFLGRVLTVCWTNRPPDIRVISARKATPTERRQYEKEK